jgi:hypothetical protein
MGSARGWRAAQVLGDAAAECPEGEARFLVEELFDAHLAAMAPAAASAASSTAAEEEAAVQLRLLTALLPVVARTLRNAPPPDAAGELRGRLGVTHVFDQPHVPTVDCHSATLKGLGIDI